MGKAKETVLELNLKALEHNYNYLKSLLLPTTKFLAVVKAFAYGSDQIAIAQKLEKLKVDYFAVAYVKEGVALRDAGIKTPILVLHPQPTNFKTLIARNLEPSLYSQKVLQEFLKTTQEEQQSEYPVHLKFNTGLNRLGFVENDLAYLGLQLQDQSHIKVLSVFSHLAATEDPKESDFTTTQISTFDRIASEVNKMLGYKPFRHLLNTSGIINYTHAQYEMVRSGIGLYGFGNHEAVDAVLKPVATLKTVISQLHQIQAGESVGYNRAFTSAMPKVIATLPIGHADGIGRQYGNEKAFVTIGDYKAAIIGNVCMDMMMIDVTGISCEEGDEVIVFGTNTTAENMANAVNTISYELLTGIGQRVKRNVLKN